MVKYMNKNTQILRYKCSITKKQIQKKMKMKCTTLPPESGSGCQSAKHRWRTNFQKIETIPLRNSALLSCEHTLVVFFIRFVHK